MPPLKINPWVLHAGRRLFSLLFTVGYSGYPTGSGDSSIFPAVIMRN